jgi:hypothetical protein
VDTAFAAAQSGDIGVIISEVLSNRKLPAVDELSIRCFLSTVIAYVCRGDEEAILNSGGSGISTHESIKIPTPTTIRIKPATAPTAIRLRVIFLFIIGPFQAT